MKISDFLSRLQDLDIKIWLDGDHLRINAPKGAVTPELQSEIVANKEEIIRFLKEAQAASVPAPAPIRHIENQETFPLSFSQQRLWFLNQYEPDNTAYTIVKVYEAAGILDVSALEESIQRIIERHSILRTVFAADEKNQPVQRILPAALFQLPVIDLQDVPFDQREELAQSKITEQTQEPLDLKKGPLFGATLYRIEPERHWLVVLMHHIISDGWSTGILQQELQTFYQACKNNQPAPLPELSVQYSDFATWQRQRYGAQEQQTALDYWRKNLHGPLPILEIPGDHPRPATVTYHGASLRERLPVALIEQVGHICSQHETTPFMFLLAAFEVLLHRYSRAEDIIVGTPVANRSQVEVENLIGFFVNTLALRTDLSGDPSFLDLLARVRETSLQAFAHQDLPFEMVVEAVNPERDPSHNPIFQVMFIVQNTPTHDKVEKSADFRIKQIWFDPHTAKFDLTLEIFHNQDGVFYDFEYNTDLFEAETIQRMLGHYRTILEGICANPAQAISQLPLLTVDERQQILQEWNDTCVAMPDEQTVHELVEAQVDRTPQRAAITDEAGEITFAELDRRANQLAHYLRGRGVGPETLVGISLPRTAEMVIAMLGIFKAGGGYLPLDPNYPANRLAYMLENSGAQLVITHSSLLEHFSAQQVEFICLDSDAPAIAAQSGERLDCAAGPENLAYLIYTSGSTGQPKGVQVLQKGMVNVLASMRQDLALDPADVVLSITTLSFDIAEMEIYLPLIVGARLVIASNAAASDGVLLCKELERSQATFLQATPATLRLLVTSGWQGGAQFKILSGGEALAPDLAARLTERCGTLWNGYGPTETAIYSTRCLIPADFDQITIGRPVANTQVYLLDPGKQSVPVGIPGEMYIGGIGVARGYRNLPEMTAERFVKDPFSNQPGARMYRTGDLARYLPDGRIDYLGRNDDQVKINGVRIELGEVSGALLQHPAVKAGVVTAWKEASGQQYLAAYVVNQPDEKLTADDLRLYLAGKMPTAMVPARFVFLDQLPLSPNGKVDRKALPEPTREIVDAEAHSKQINLIEARLIQIWKKLLNVERVGITDDFFELGGHSMLAVRMFIQIQEVFGVNLPLISIFRKANIQYLAGLIEQEQHKNGLTTWSSLVDLQSNGERPPLFCIHGMPGDVLWYSRLVAHMDPGQPIWGLQSKGLDGVSQPLPSIEVMAEHYIHEIESIQPDGPYYLCGYSFGGTVAYEMSRQLMQQGKEVGLLALIDHASPKSGYLEVKFSWFFLKSFIRNLPYRIGDLFNLSPEELFSRIQRSFKLTKKALAAKRNGDQSFELEPGEIIVNAEQLSEPAQRLIKINYKAMIDYFPPPYDGVITLLRARGGHLFVSHDPEMGWGKFAKKVDIRIIPGSHLGLFRDPHIRHLAGALQRCLDETQPGFER